MPRKISDSTWAEIRTAHAAGIGLREMARNLSIPEGTVLARAKREGWTRQIQDAKALAPAPMQSTAITPAQSAALTMAERGARHVERMAGVADRVGPHVETMTPGEVLDRIDRVERFDRMARRTFGLDVAHTLSGGGLLGLHVTVRPPDGMVLDVEAIASTHPGA
jgi:hypothetical protein